ncbi:MAG: TRAP transporter small permease [Desulfobacterales bacterium]|nr:TRAP transporter small permease [Desulfobacterales bacterium]
MIDKESKFSVPMLDKIEFWLISALYSYMTAVIVVEVFRRYVLGAATTWGEETAIYAFVWMTYLAAAHRVHGRRHLSLDILRTYMNRGQKFLSFMLSDLCFLILSATVIYYSIRPVWLNIKYGQQMIGVDIPMAIATLSIPCCWALIAFRVIQRCVTTIHLYRHSQPLE